MRSRAKTSLLVLIGVEMLAVRALSQLGSAPFLRTPGLDIRAWRLWLAATPPQDAVASVLRLVASGGAWWLLAASGLYLAATLTRIPGLIRATQWSTPRPVRRLIDRAVALSLVATLAGGGAAFAGSGAPPAPAPVVVRVGGRPGVLLPPGARPLPTPGASPQPAPPAPGRPERHAVRAGDNLWSIAAGHLAAGGITLSNGRIAPYWRDLVQDNRAGLRSGDPDLIFPGESVSLPPIT